MEIVPYELAKKLKEKGFNAESKYSLGYYDKLGNFMSAADHWFLNGWIIAPTISQVLKWLREEKKIDISPCCYRDFQGEFMGWYYLIVDMRADVWQYIAEETRKDNSKSTYESAALAGIEYVIDNLI